LHVRTAGYALLLNIKNCFKYVYATAIVNVWAAAITSQADNNNNEEDR